MNPQVIIREQPPNPHIYNYHVRQQLTCAMAEIFRSQEQETQPSASAHREGHPWLAALLALDGITEVHLLRHHLRLRKSREASWPTPKIEEILTQSWQALWAEEEKSERKQSFPLPAIFASASIQAFEGVDEAQRHPLASALFAIPGIILATWSTESLQIKRGGAYRWDELQPNIDAVIQQFSTPASLPGIQAKESSAGQTKIACRSRRIV